MPRKISKAKNSRPRKARAPAKSRAKYDRKAMLVDKPLIRPAPDTSLEAPDKMELEARIEFKLESEFAKIPESLESQIIPLMVTVAPVDVELGYHHFGIDLVMVIDISGSMGGEKINLVRSTLLFVIDELRETDRLSLIAFESNTVILAGLTPMTPDAKAHFKDIVEREIREKGSTRMQPAIEDAYQVLLNRVEMNEQTAIFLLSDGQDDGGMADPIINNCVKPNDLEMKRRGMNYKIHSFGYGEGHDEKILGGIARETDGNFYFVKDITLVDECFIDCLGGMMGMMGRAAVAAVHMLWNVELVERSGESWLPAEDSKEGKVKIGSLCAGKERNFVAKIRVPPTAGLDEVRLGKAVLTYLSGKDTNTVETELKLAVTSSGDLGPRNIKVEQNLVRERVARTLQEAEQDFKNGNKEKARASLEQLRQALEDAGVSQIESVPVYEMLHANALEDEKNLIENQQILARQDYRPQKCRSARRNKVQEAMLQRKLDNLS